MNLIFCLAWKVLRLHSMCVYNNNNNEQYAVDGNGTPHPILCDLEVNFGATLKQPKMKMGAQATVTAAFQHVPCFMEYVNGNVWTETIISNKDAWLCHFGSTFVCFLLSCDHSVASGITWHMRTERFRISLPRTAVSQWWKEAWVAISTRDGADGTFTRRQLAFRFNCVRINCE